MTQHSLSRHDNPYRAARYDSVVGRERVVRQVRYAVVLNGGVSLAVWMGGVTHELNRIRLASEGILHPHIDIGASTAWTAILSACDRSAVVDIVAGTSAGGLNGTLLATAVARGADMPDMGEQWASVASLGVDALTRRETAGAQSVLDGDYFNAQVGQILDMIEVQWAELARECTLLVTATALDSKAKPTRLETGNDMFTRDGRRVYKFERKIGPESRGAVATNDFDASGESVAALVRAARASASYPVAFVPVWETAGLIEKRSTVAADVPARWLVDGGILDNAPFEPLIEVLRERPTNEPYDRVLLYVTPGIREGEEPEPPIDTPNLKQTMGSVWSAVREPDERLDADALHHIFRQMSYTKSQAHRTIVDYLLAPEAVATAPLLEAAALVFEGYRTARAEATERWLNSLSGQPEASTLAPPPLTVLTPDEMPGIPPAPFPAFDGATWQWGWRAADRILRWWGRALSAPDLKIPALDAAMKRVGQAQRDVSARWPDLKQAVSGDATNPLTLDEQVTQMNGVYSSGPNSLQNTLAEVIIPTAEEIAAAVPGTEAEMLIKISLGVEVVSGLFSWRGDDYDVPVFRFHNVTPAVMTPPGIDLGAIGEQTDWPAKKLYGERLGHFGAFVSAEGRRHDWMWGRLDGASELSKQLLAAANLPESTAESLRTALINEVLASEDTTADDVAKDARNVFSTSAAEMLEEMAHSDAGESFRHLQATVWELTRQFGAPGAWLRVVLAAHWSPSAEPAKLSLGQRILMRTARILTIPLRRQIRSKLPGP